MVLRILQQLCDNILDFDVCFGSFTFFNFNFELQSFSSVFPLANGQLISSEKKKNCQIKQVFLRCATVKISSFMLTQRKSVVFNNDSLLFEFV